MRPKHLQEWRDRHEHSLASGAAALGIGKSTFAAMLAGTRPISETVALLTVAIDRLAELEDDD